MSRSGRTERTSQRLRFTVHTVLKYLQTRGVQTRGCSQMGELEVKAFFDSTRLFIVSQRLISEAFGNFT